MDCPYFSVLEFGVFDSNVKFPRRTTTDPRLVDCFELEFYNHGAPGKTYLDGRWHPLPQGTFICAKPGSIRKSLLPFKCCYLHLQTEDPLLLEILGGMGDLFCPPQTRQLVQLWNEMLPLDPQTRPEDRLLLESCVCRLIHLLHRYHHIQDTPGSQRSTLHQKELLHIEQYIRTHLAEDLRLETLAAACNLSPTYFHSVFTEFFQKTPSQFILDCRITAAKTGLLTGDYSLAQLAADCGFSSQSYFCYKFKQATGQSPLQFRKEQLGRLKL